MPKKIKRIKSELVEVKTEAKYLPISPRKFRILASSLKLMRPQEALSVLSLTSQKGAKFLTKAVKTAIADAENNFQLIKDSLRFKSILVNEGPRFKKRDKYHGARFNGGIILKKRTHLVIKLVGEKSHGEKS